GREVELHRPHEKLDPGRDEEDDELAVAKHRTNAGLDNDQPGAPSRSAATVTPVTLIVDGHAYSSPTACAKTSSSVGTLGRRCRTCACSAAAIANSWRAPPSPGTNTLTTSSSVAWQSRPAARSRSKNASRSEAVL